MLQLKRFFTCCLLVLIPTLAIAKIVFVSKRAGASDIHVMDDDGSNVQRLTSVNPFESDIDPKWAPDGQHIAFLRQVSRDRIQEFQLFVIAPDGSNIQQLTFPPMKSGLYHTWGPDGRRIAFSGFQNGDGEIYIIDIVTREIQQLTDTKDGSAGHPDWSPDGKYIAYDQGLANGESGIYVMRANGKGAKPFIPIWEGNLYRDDFQWSPDSTSLLYSERGIGENGKHLGSQVVIQKYNSATGKGGARQFLNTPKDWLIHSLAWMDNGKEVLITAEEHDAPVRQYDIYRYHLATGEITNLTNIARDDYFPDWISDDVLSVTPHGKKIVTWGTLKK